jgi:hypothetical protein
MKGGGESSFAFSLSFVCRSASKVVHGVQLPNCETRYNGTSSRRHTSTAYCTSFTTFFPLLLFSLCLGLVRILPLNRESIGTSRRPLHRASTARFVTSLRCPLQSVVIQRCFDTSDVAISFTQRHASIFTRPVLGLGRQVCLGELASA